MRESRPTIHAYLPSIRASLADKPHATRLRYLGGCRCVPCRAANSRYETERAKARRNGDWNGIVSAATARAWMLRLSEKGVGRHSVSAASGVSDFILYEIITGARPRIRARTERKIIAVDESCRADRSLVSARATWKRIDALVCAGYTKTWIAKQLGKAAAIQFNRERVTAKNARAVERLCRLIDEGKGATPMTITEACAVNVLLSFLLDEVPVGAPGTPTIQAIANAGATLAKSAHKALLSGHNEETWRKKWRARATP